MDRLRRRVLPWRFTAVVVGSLGWALPLTAAAEEAQPTTGKEESLSSQRMTLRVTPPLSNLPLADAKGIFLGGLGVGWTAPSGFWFEVNFAALSAIEGVGYQATMAAGLTLQPTARVPHEWGFSLPFYGGYRYAAIPPSKPTDGHTFLQKLHMLGMGARPTATRVFADNAFEVGVDLGIFVPVYSDIPQSDYYQDKPVGMLLDLTLFVGFSFGLGGG